MAEPTIQLGGGNWAGKSDNLLGYYKEGERFYKQDFTFSRSTTGTYTDSDGYIQEMPYNLVTYSEDFTQWTNTRSSDEYGYASPFDKNNASLLISDTTASSSHIIKSNSISIQSGQKYTYSIYLKANQLNYVRVLFADTTVSKFLSAYFNLSSGLVGTTSEGSTATLDSATIENIGDGWFRCVVSGDLDTTTTAQLRVYLAEGDNDSSFDGNGSSSIYIYGAQLVKGTSAKTYFPTTTRLNMPRVDYLNNSKGSLILEPQRTNVVTESSDFSTYSSQNITTLANNSTSPDGTINANKATPNTANGQHRYTPSYSVTSSTKYAASVFAKKDGYNKIRIAENATTGGYADFDLLNGQVLSTSNVDSAIIEDYGDGWYRCIMVETTGSTSFRFDIIVLDDDNNTSFVGDGTSSVLLWGAQLEQGSYATTLINTSGSSVTRNADACIITNVADRIGQTEGTLYSEFDLTEDVNGTLVEINLGNSISNRILAYRSLSYIQFIVQVGGVIQINNATLVSFANTNKIAVTYQTNDFKIFLNGSLVKTYTSGNIPSGFDTIDLQDNNLQGRKQGIKDLKLYNTRLSNSELATLTTL